MLNSIYFISDQKIPSLSCSVTAIAKHWPQLWRFDNIINQFWAEFHCAARNDYLGASGQKSDTVIRSGDLDVL